MAARPDAPRKVVAPESGANGRRGLVDLTVLAVEDILRLVQQEIQLAKLELKEMLVSSAWGVALLAAAGLFALLFLIFLFVTLALVFPLPASPHALAAGIETGVFLVLAAALGLIGKSRLRIGAPPKTMTSLKEDAEWAKNLLKRNGK
jgi:uncharacterized membrane protein YqjE